MKNDGSITSEQKRLFAFLSSSTTGCRYCQAHTLLAAERYGASKERLENIWDFENQDCYTESEKAAFRFVIAASKVPVAVTEDIESEMKTHWSDNQIVEIMGVVALFGYLNRWNDVMGTTLEDAAASFASENIKNWSIGKHSS
jgi:AhpD family alkylhydroperoxidase